MNRRIQRLGAAGGLLVVAVAATVVRAATPEVTRARPAHVKIGERQVPVYPGTLPPSLALSSPGRTEAGHEYLVVRTAARANAVVLVTVENGPLTLRYAAETIGKGRQLEVARGDFPSLAASGLHSPTELARTTSITGRTVQRRRPQFLVSRT